MKITQCVSMNERREKSPLNDSSPPPLSFSSFPASIGTIYELFLRETFRLSYPFFSLSLFLLNKYLSFDFLFLRFSLSLSFSQVDTREKYTRIYQIWKFSRYTLCTTSWRTRLPRKNSARGWKNTTKNYYALQPAAYLLDNKWLISTRAH